MNIIKIIRKNIYTLSMILLIVIICGIVIIKNNLKNKNVNVIESDIVKLMDSNEEIDLVNVEDIEKDIDIYVDIKGSVSNPGVYKMNVGDRVKDVINNAGGLIEDADTSLINLAKKVIDEMVIIIYTKEEVNNTNTSNTVVKIIEKECNCPNIINDACINNEEKIESEGVLDSKISINTATIEELQSLTGIGLSKAKSIIEYREKFGLFKNIEDIMNVSGIGESVYNSIKENITL